MDQWRCQKFTELWRETNRNKDEDHGLPEDSLEYLEEETLTIEGSEDVDTKIKSTHHYLRAEPTFELLKAVLRCIKIFNDCGEVNIAGLIQGANVKAALRCRLTGRSSTLKNSETAGKRRFGRANHQLMYVIAQVSRNLLF